MDPPVATIPLKILSLDGGGIRGLSSLLILENVMERICKAENLDAIPRPCDRFDLIGGTSTGGIIAIMLGRLGMTVTECIQAYRVMAEKAFTRKRTTIFPGSSRGAFSATALEEAIRDIIKAHCTAAGAVIAITKDNLDAKPTLFTTYDTSASLSGCTIWQVARATSAATTFFKPIRVGRDEVEFIDAGFGHNNPGEALVEEAQRRFPGRDRIQILSIGTGLGDVVSITDKRLDIIKALKKMATSSKQVASRLDGRYGHDGQYFRFSVERGLEDTTLSDWKKASKISAHTRNYLDENERHLNTFVNAFLGRGSRPAVTPLAGPDVVSERRGHHYLPLSKNRHFVGRTEIINRLKKKLFDDDTTARVAVVGLGGVGKTQVALQVAQWTTENKPECSVFWMPALSVASFEQACGDIVKQVGIATTRGEDAKELVQAYLDSDQSGDWLVVIDNADERAVLSGTGGTNGIKMYLPRNDRGRLLFTTRSRDVGMSMADGDVVDLDNMSPREARDLLERRTRPELVADDALVTTFLNELAYLPLAITQAAAYLTINRTSIKTYLGFLRSTEIEMTSLLSREFDDQTRHKESKHAVATTWLVSFEEIRKSDENATRLLSFMSYIEPRAIPMSILPKLETEEATVYAMGTLKGYGFIQERDDDQIVDMHRLVHLATRIWVQKREDEEEELAITYQSNGQVKEAISLLEYLVAVKKRMLMEEDRSRLASQHVLASAYLANGQVKEAVSLLEYVVAIRERTLAEENPSRLASQHELAIAYQANEQVKEAVGLLEHVVAVQKRTLTEEHPDRLSSEEWLKHLSKGIIATKQK
ncbi:hypothetical protein ACHAQA_007841 [Verticillium albo-atrum]